MNVVDVDMSVIDCARGKCILVVGGGMMVVMFVFVV